MDPALWELLRAEKEAGRDREIEAIIRLARPGIEIPGVRMVSRFGPVATCRIPARDVVAVRARSDVVSLKAARALSPGLEPAAGPPGPVPPVMRATDVRRPPGLTVTGAGVVVAAVDWGVDVDALAFRIPPGPAASGRADPEAGGTRFLAFWDQRDQAVGPRPEPYGYGAVHDRDEINRALRDPRPYERLGYHPAIADHGTGTHGTHVLDIAAGNGRGGGPTGIAPEADLVFVHLADRDTGGLANLGDSVRLLEAVDFIARTAGSQPWAVNISIGRHGGPHDGSTLAELAFDALLAKATGCIALQSAGNYFRSRTHACGTLAPGETKSFSFVTDPLDATPNELEIWYDGDDEFAVRIDPPGHAGARAVRLGEQSDLLIGGRVIGRVYHRARDPNNGDNHIDAFLYPAGCAGTWTVTLEARRAADGRFHAWLERDDACPRCQARFSRHDANRTTTTGTLANSHLPLVVGAYDGHDAARPAASFSSVGPTADGDPKPDLVARGKLELATRSAAIGASHNSGLLVRKSGTSMAAPQVTGAVALCLELAGHHLSAREIRSAVLATCDPPRSPDPQQRLGHGYLNISRLITEVRRKLMTRETASGKKEKEPTVDTNDTTLYLTENPATAYREYVYRPGGRLARWIGDRYDVVARPGQPLDRAPQRGDLLIEVTLGQMSGGRCVTLDGRDLKVAQSRPRQPQGQLILRPRSRVETSKPMPVEPASEAEDTGLDHLLGQGRPGNQVTNARFRARYPRQPGATSRAGQFENPSAQESAESYDQGAPVADDEDEADLAGELFAESLSDTAQDAAGEWLQDAGQSSLAEFVGSEHKEIGDRGSGNENSNILFGNPPQPLTFGDVVSMAGDYFKTYSDMRELAEKAEGRSELEWARWDCLKLENQKVPEPLPPDPKKLEEIKKKVQDRYFLLATQNLSHFSAGGTAWREYSEWHIRALVDALEAGEKSNQAAWRAALTKEAFGDHFLTDMFSAGHVRTPRSEIRNWYENHFPDAKEKLTRYMAKYIYDRLNEAGGLPFLMWLFESLTTRKIVGEIKTSGGEALATLSLGDIVSLALHDRDGEGLAVVSKTVVDAHGRVVPGDGRWTAVGDGHFREGTEDAQRTVAMATAAVMASIRDLERVREAGVKLSSGPATMPGARGRADKRAAIRTALGAGRSTLGPGRFAARAYVPHEEPGANPAFASSDGTPAPLEWRWGQLGKEACCAVDKAVKGTIADGLEKKAGDVEETVTYLTMKVLGVRAAYLDFVCHLRNDGIKAIEKAIGKSAR